MASDNPITYFGLADYRNKQTRFGIKAEDRTRHVYVIGKTGMGKSTLLENLAAQDLQNDEGMGFIDPHGGSAELLLDYVPEHRIKDVIYFAPFDTDYPVAFNVMEDVGKDKRHLVASGLMSAFKKIWVDAGSARMEYILGNTILALLEFPGATLLGVNRMYSDKDYRKKVVDNITDPSIRSFWVDEYAKYGDRYTQEATPAIQNKIGQFVANPLIRNIIGQSKSTFDIRDVMNKKKLLIMNLSKGKVGDQNTSLLGSMLITKIYLAAMSRADVSRAELKALPNFNFFVDEFQSFANESFADILSEARKYKLNLTIAHQYIEQMPDEVRSAVFGNVGTMITFRVGSFDADVLEKEFMPAFTAEDIVNLDKYQMYLRLMIDGVGSKPFSAMGLPPISKETVSFKDQIIANSRQYFAKKREDVEQEILEWHKTSFAEVKPPAPPYVPKDGTPIIANRPSEFPPRSFSAPQAQSSYQPPAQINTPSRPPFQQQTPYQPSQPRNDSGSAYPPRQQSSSSFQSRPDRRQADRRQGESTLRFGAVDRRAPAPISSTVPTSYEPRPAPQNPPMQNIPPRPREPQPLPVPVAFTPATPVPTMSLSALRKDHNEPSAHETQSRNQLKDALAALAKEKPKPQPTPVPVPRPAPVLEKKVEEKQPEPPSAQRQPTVISHAGKPKEIPEDVLRAMLETED